MEPAALMAAAQITVTLSADASALRGFVRQAAEQIARLGLAEAERRIGRPIDGLLIEELVEITPQPQSKDAIVVQLLPTAEFRRVLEALSRG
jgi:hypothetical protein